MGISRDKICVAKIMSFLLQATVHHIHFFHAFTVFFQNSKLMRAEINLMQDIYE